MSILNRNLTNKIRFVLDQLLPPILRDSKTLMRILIGILYKDAALDFMNFKEKAPFLTDEEYKAIYAKVAHANIDRETDCNKESIQTIIENIAGSSVLEVATGRGYLANKIAKKNYTVSATDMIIDPEVRHKYPRVHFEEAFVENLPYADKTFDTVVCTHCLEHVRDIPACMQELRRVAKKRLIIVVPMQRPYKYTFDLHINFFPYTHSFLQAITFPKKQHCDVIKCIELKGDIYYQEEIYA